MKEYRIVERITFVHFVEAENEEEAREAVKEVSLNAATAIESAIESVEACP